MEGSKKAAVYSRQQMLSLSFLFLQMGLTASTPLWYVQELCWDLGR